MKLLVLLFQLIILLASSLSTTCPGSLSPLHFYPGNLPFHHTGVRDPSNSTAWVVTVQDPSHQFMTYGPYTDQISDAPQGVDFLLSIDNNAHDDVGVLILDVHDVETDTVLAERTVHRHDFPSPFTPRVFSLFFTNSRCSRKLEFRVFYLCCSEIIHFDTVVAPLDVGDFGRNFFDAGMQGSLPSHHFELVSANSFPTSPSQPSTAFANVGEDIHIDPVNSSVWWNFYREYAYGPTPEACQKKIGAFRIVLRRSDNLGLTWSTSKWIIAEPNPTNPSLSCALTDGTAFYDPDETTWHYLTQCIGTEGGWNLCEYSLRSRDPSSGPWIDNAANPIVKGGQLFAEICQGKGKHCSTKTVDEGTPQIVEKSANGQFIVTFHGYDYQAKKSVRGVASTNQNFTQWTTCNSFDLPCDVIFSHLDCDHWKIDWAEGGCVGGGQASIFKSGDYYYQLIEAPDVSLECLTAQGQQNWVYGWLRSPSLRAVAGEWEQFQNPAVVPWVKRGYTLQYNRQWVTGDGVMYLMYYVLDFETGKPEMQLWQLVKGQRKEPLPIVAKMY